MPVNQIFNRIIPEKLLLKILNGINISNLKDLNTFTYKKIEDNREFLKKIMQKVKPYYIPCKRRVYFPRVFTTKKFITILRQILKLYDYTLITKERYLSEKKKKYLQYSLKPINYKNDTIIRTVQANIVLSFN